MHLKAVERSLQDVCHEKALFSTSALFVDERVERKRILSLSSLLFLLFPSYSFSLLRSDYLIVFFYTFLLLFRFRFAYVLFRNSLS